jgi:hypothetical protein
MNYIHPELLSKHWYDIYLMVEENYSNGVGENDLLIIGYCVFKSVSEIKNDFPGYERYIVYQLEPLNDKHWHTKDKIIENLIGADEVWDYDLENIEKLKHFDILAKYKPFVYTERLKRVKNIEEPDIDILFYGTLSEQRLKILSDISCSYELYKTVFIQNFEQEKLDEYLSRSKVVLDLHTDDGGVQKQSRIYYALINNKCVLSEKSNFNYFGDLIIESETHQLKSNIINILKNDIWKNYSNVSEKFKLLNKNMLIENILDDFNINGSHILGGTDKASIHSYNDVYDKLFLPYKEKKGNLLEIGIYGGGSMLLWNEYFKNYKICGVDIENLIQDNINNYINQHSDKIDIIINDAYSDELVNNLKDKYGHFDIIIDDGPHNEESQIMFIKKYLPLLNNDGLLIVEDIWDINSVNKFINSIPYSDEYEYQYNIYDLRDIKNRWDDILFVIKKVEKVKNESSKPKICMIGMFKNESKGILRMLESVCEHIDFYIFQDNGSTDGTPDIVRDFFKDKNIPGFIYEIEEGWVGFGWNRDHLLQRCLSTDHGCDWIMKMDCDEYLEVDDDFDWSLFYDKEIQSFHVTAESPGCMYYRAWIWNSKLPWKFKHDLAHECIYLDNEIGENFQRYNLPRGFRMIGTTDGESYTVRTKYISDALKLEEELIREERMLEDTYHFWYIGKSYMDAFMGDFYPLGKAHSDEFARRALFYFTEYIKHIFGDNTPSIHEMVYFTKVCIGQIHKYFGEYDLAINHFKESENYCQVRNEHIVELTKLYSELEKWDDMLEQTERLISPDRKIPFPDYYFLLDTNIYIDSDNNYVNELHQLAISKTSKNEKIFNMINSDQKKRIFVVDDFYSDPYAVRDLALQQEFHADSNWYKGKRTNEQIIFPGTKEAFEKIIGQPIINWSETHGMCGRFQSCTSEDALVYHWDGQQWAGMVYLTPDAPYVGGTSLFAHKKTRIRHEADPGSEVVFEGGFYDRSKFELVDTVGNVFNRLVIFDARSIHAANEYFGNNLETSRLFHMFFFD